MSKGQNVIEKPESSVVTTSPKDRRGSGPVRLSRELIKRAKLHDVNSVTYHISVCFQSFTSTLPHMHFLGNRHFSRHNLPPEHAEVLGKCHEFLVQLGKPIVLSKYLKGFMQMEPKLTEEIWGAASEFGVHDQFMVPVYGPYNVNGVISFGFPRVLDWENDGFLEELETLAMTHHARSVRFYGSGHGKVDLSARESDVLKWIAKGKSNTDIAEILGISTSSVDTYTRRLFEKMGVNDRISATVAGLRRRLIMID